ncbi:hypothetical protein CUJ89_02650 [Burkholderia pyrrocinia]|uniref:Uncharacterized protein n=1 Tax=Burkholderia pyrrocinia TaxID=60550 RepID=A0A2Z5MST0_BURPY|nr:hypothetical protein CUJ89_02650 [Burkholderia pyrrocinia]
MWLSGTEARLMPGFLFAARIGSVCFPGRPVAGRASRRSGRTRGPGGDCFVTGRFSALRLCRRTGKEKGARRRLQYAAACQAS